MTTEVEIESLFRPSSASIRQLLSDVVGGFAIPSYQRPYRWKPTDIKRLFESIMIGLERLVDDPEGVTFIGAVITVTGVSEHHKNRPKDPRQIIDGQQRLSTILLMAAAIHEFLSKNVAPIKRESHTGPDAQIVEWLLDQCGELQEQLLDCLADVRTYGDPEFKALPKIIREVADIWSTKADSARYISPISHLLHGYLRAARESIVFKISIPDVQVVPEGVGSSQEDHEVLQRRFGTIQSLVRDVSNGREGELSDAINFDFLLKKDSKVLPSLFNEFDTDETTLLRSLLQRSHKIATVFRLMLFSRFLLERICLTQINARSEAYAFELFESLNSTGEPLTSFETFIPLVVESETSNLYHQSPSYDHVSSTSKLLSERADAVQVETARLITAFLLADVGQKVPAKHNEQRRALSKRYSDAENLIQKRAMTEQLADSALMYFRVWRDGQLAIAPHLKAPHHLNPETEFALGFLKAINHTVVLAPLMRYFSAYKADPTPSTCAEFETAVKAATAFSILWRAAHGGTDGIDSQYRSLVKDGVRDGGSVIVGPLARTQEKSHDLNELPSAREFADGLRYLANSARTYGFDDKESFFRVAEARPIYEEAQLARVLLLLASHHTVPNGSSGHTKDGRDSDATDMLRRGFWGPDARLATIEHVAPQTPRGTASGQGWDSKIYDQGFVHRLGNLVLLPVEDNAFLGNRSWREKRTIYNALSTQDPDEVIRIFSESEADGLSFSSSVQEKVIQQRKHLPMLQAIGSYSGSWDRDFIEQRTRLMLGRAYDRLDRWLHCDS
ncbi:DUF262 domain-containing protein [Streptosporangium roseum]|uniref:DUF262 domain-containing protein n=1 Tax=Streptosporangium roseum TaxID=2001 RepID=UPI000A4BA9D9|nr:DUF262 domain-containing HNH endonuclease family protein [Streptosporangium roseum]